MQPINPQKTFAASSTEIASRLKLAIQHEDDLLLAGVAYLAGNPNGSEAQFVQWANTVQAMPRYPELLDFGNAVIVPASDLAAFSVWAQAHPSVPLGANGTFEVEPPGRRAYYCLGTVDNARNMQVGAPADRISVQLGLDRPSFRLEILALVRTLPSRLGKRQNSEFPFRTIAAVSSQRRSRGVVRRSWMVRSID